jgi:crotonobetaine/carnitine-CoA ligase
MTETIGHAIVSDRRFLEGPEFGMGWPAPEYEISIRRANGHEVDFGEIGRLWIRGIRGISLFAEYLNDSKATASAFDSNGWFDTGDDVIPMADGNIQFSSRAVDTLRVGGESVSPNEIELAIRKLPQVQEVAIVGQPNRFLGEVPIAFVVAQSQNAELKQAIFAICKELLAEFKRPADIVFVDSLPKGLLGKVLKNQLRDQLVKTDVRLRGQ